MKKRIGAIIVLALAQMSGTWVVTASADSAPAPASQKRPATKTTIDARHYREAARPYYPHYYDRPYYYAPAPFFLLPPFFGYGFESWR